MTISSGFKNGSIFSWASTSTSTFVLDVIIKGQHGTVVTYSNPVSSNPAVATVAIDQFNDLGVRSLSSGTVDVTFDYTGSNGVTGTMTWTIIYN